MNDVLLIPEEMEKELGLDFPKHSQGYMETLDLKLSLSQLRMLNKAQVAKLNKNNPKLEVIGKTLMELLVGLGIVRKEATPTYPELIMAAEEYLSLLKNRLDRPTEVDDAVLIGILESLCNRLDTDKDLAEIKTIGYVLDMLKNRLDRPEICRDCPTFTKGCEGSNQEDCARMDRPDREEIISVLKKGKIDMKSDLIKRVNKEIIRQIEKWGATDENPTVLVAATAGELGEVWHALSHNEGVERIHQEISETIATLVRLYAMVDEYAGKPGV